MLSFTLATAAAAASSANFDNPCYTVQNDLDQQCWEKPNEPLTEEEAMKWVVALKDAWYAHPMESHPMMPNLAAGAYPDHVAATATFAQQVFAFARDFRSICGMAIGKLACCDDVGDNLRYHLKEENGFYPQEDLDHILERGVDIDQVVGIPHIELWAALLDDLNLDKYEAFYPEALALNEWAYTHALRHSSTSIAAIIFGIELWSKDLGRDMMPALNNAGIDAKGQIFFKLHAIIDDEIHVEDIGGDLISLLTNQVPENSLNDLKEHLFIFQEFRRALYDKLHGDFMAMPEAQAVPVGDAPACQPSA